MTFYVPSCANVMKPHCFHTLVTLLLRAERPHSVWPSRITRLVLCCAELAWQPKHLVLEASTRFPIGKGCFMQLGTVASRTQSWSAAVLAKTDLFW